MFIQARCHEDLYFDGIEEIDIGNTTDAVPQVIN